MYSQPPLRLANAAPNLTSYHHHHHHQNPSPSPTRLTVTHPLSTPAGPPLASHLNPSDRSSRSRPYHHVPLSNSALTLYASSAPPVLFDASLPPHRLRSDSQNSHRSSSHGSSHRSFGPSVKLPSSCPPNHLSTQSPSFTPSSCHRTTSSSNTSSPNIPRTGPISARASSSPTRSFNSTHQPSSNPLAAATMVRRSSPLAQSNSNVSHDLSIPHSTTLPSYRNSSASTATITSIPSTIVATPLALPPNAPDHEAEEDSDTASDVDLRPPGHRSTPGTSVDSSSSNFTQPEDVISDAPHSNALDSPQDTRLHKHSKQSLGNKLRRALNINALHENMIHNSIPELDPAVGGERLKSSSASIAGVPLSSSTTSKGKTGSHLGAGRRFGFLNPKSNSSTDNLSISSTVSSASVMIRKLGNLGRSARRGNVMGLTKIFKDKNEVPANAEGDNIKTTNTKTDKSKRLSSSQQQKNVASASVTQVQAEVDRSLSAEFPGMTPAAAFIHKQKQQFAQQEAAAAAANSSANRSHVPDSLKPNSKLAPGGKSSSSVPVSATEARKKMIEKEKEKLKSSKKSRKWGFGALVGGGNAPETLSTSSSLEDPPHCSDRGSDAEDSHDWDETTVRQAKSEDLIPSSGAPVQRSFEELREDDDSEDDEEFDEYDMDSLFGNPSSDALTPRISGLKPRPSKEAAPKKGILKNAQNFSQESHLSPASLQSKSLSAATTPDSPGSAHLVDDPAQTLPQLGKNPAALLSGIASAGPDLSLSFNGLGIQERRAKFAQHLSVHTTWPAAIYDRRGELATCNRLTPTLAQRIKEEINAFKMEEMDVHFASRAHTHFFV